MILTEQKELQKIKGSLKGYSKIFLIGCGECATAAKTGGEKEVAKIAEALKEEAKVIVGSCVVSSPCVAAKLKSELLTREDTFKETEAILVLACGLGVQSVKDNLKAGLPVIPALNTICSVVMDARGNFYEKCSLCADCILDKSDGICPTTLCPKGLLNGPCGGMNNGKCEIDNEQDCVWVLIYERLAKKGKMDFIREIQPPKDFKKNLRPHKLIVRK